MFIFIFIFILIYYWFTDILYISHILTQIFIYVYDYSYVHCYIYIAFGLYCSALLRPTPSGQLVSHVSTPPTPARTLPGPPCNRRLPRKPDVRPLYLCLTPSLPLCPPPRHAGQPGRPQVPPSTRQDPESRFVSDSPNIFFQPGSMPEGKRILAASCTRLMAFAPPGDILTENPPTGLG